MTYQEFKESVIRAAREMEIADYELYYTENESVSVEIYKDEVKSYGTEDSSGICFRCIVEGRAGYASTEDLTEEEARALVTRALDNAGAIESEESSFLSEKSDINVINEEGASSCSGTELIDAALTLQKEMYHADFRVADGTQAYMIRTKERYALCNSRGLDLEDKASYEVCYAMPIVESGGEKYDGDKDRRGRLRDFDLKAVAKEAVEEAVSSIGAGSVSGGTYTVLFSGKAMAALLRTYSEVFSAEAAQKGLSLLSGKEGEKIAADIVTITDDPRYKDSVTKRSFDGEGTAACAKNVVENGILTTLLHNLKTAAKAGVKSTGNAGRASYASVIGVSPYTFYIVPGEGTGDAGALQEAAGEGIYVTELTGLHAGANTVSGDFSLSSSGFLITEGKKGAPVKNFTVSGNFFTLLKEIERVGTDLEFAGGKFGSPSVLIRGMAVAGSREEN